MAELVDHVDDLLADEARGQPQAIAADLVETGAPPKLAAMVANLFAVDGSVGLARLARDTGIAPVRADPRRSATSASGSGSTGRSSRPR